MFSSARLCSNFFTVLPWTSSPNSRANICEHLDQYESYYSLLSLQMISMNTTLVIVTNERFHHCPPMHYPNIHFHSLNISQLFHQYHINSTSFTLQITTDLVKLLVAHQFQFTYIQFGIHFLSNLPDDYSQQFLTIQIWNHMKCSQQISNLAFCLSQNMLEELIHGLLERAMSIVDDINPSPGTPLFTQILPNKYPLRLYSLNHPEIFTISKIHEDYMEYEHKLLYLPVSALTTHPSLASFTYLDYINAIRHELGFTPLHPVSTASNLSLTQLLDQDLFKPRTPLESLSEIDLSPILSHLYYLLDILQWDIGNRDSAFNPEILQAARSLLTSLSSQHPSPFIRRQCLQLLFLFTP